MASAAEAAGHVFLSPSRFRDLISVGVFKRMPSGGYILDQVREEYCRHAQRAMAGRGNDDGSKALSQQRAALAAAQTKAAELRTGILAREFVSLSAVQRAFERDLMVFKERCMTMPGKVSDSLTPHTPRDRAQIEDTIRDEVYSALTDLSSPDFWQAIRQAGGRGTKQKIDVDDAEEELA